MVTYRPDRSADVSPVWFRCTDRAFEVVVAEDDPKHRYLSRDSRAILTVFETVHPFRGVKVAAEVELDRDAEAVRHARLAIHARFLGPAEARAFVASLGEGVIVRFPVAAARVWDLSQILPPRSASGEWPA